MNEYKKIKPKKPKMYADYVKEAYDKGELYYEADKITPIRAIEIYRYNYRSYSYLHKGVNCVKVNTFNKHNYS